MLYTGIDYHKRYSVVSTMDATGARGRKARIDENEPAAFAVYFQHLPEPSHVVMEVTAVFGFGYPSASVGLVYPLLATCLSLSSQPSTLSPPA